MLSLHLYERSKTSLRAAHSYVVFHTSMLSQMPGMSLEIFGDDTALKLAPEQRDDRSTGDSSLSENSTPGQ